MEVRNRFKGLELTKRLITYRRRFMALYRNRNQDRPQEKEMQKTKWLSGEAVQIAVKRKEAKAKKKRKDIPFECRLPKNSKER